MNENRLTTSTWYEAKSINDTHGLGWNMESVEKLKEMIDYEEDKAKRQGYHGEKWLVVQGRMNKIFTRTLGAADDEERFSCEYTVRKAIGVYENGEITLFEENEGEKT